jgi:hypothetical protein
MKVMQVRKDCAAIRQLDFRKPCFRTRRIRTARGGGTGSSNHFTENSRTPNDVKPNYPKRLKVTRAENEIRVRIIEEYSGSFIGISLREAVSGGTVAMGRQGSGNFRYSTNDLGH